MPLVDVAVCFDGLLKRVAPIDDGAQLVSLDYEALREVQGSGIAYAATGEELIV